MNSIDIINFSASLLALASSSVTAVFWVKARKRQRRMNEPITLTFVYASTSNGARKTKHIFPYQPPRSSFTRAEVAGLIGLVPTIIKDKKPCRYQCKFLQSQEFFDRLESIRNGSANTLEIDFTKKELSLFKIEDKASSSKNNGS